MSGVVCAIRGGPHSQLTIACATELAIAHDCPLYFLYIADIEFLAHSSQSRVHTITQEMHFMGDFIVSAAQMTAAELGAQAHGVVREGSIGDEIIALCQETGAEYVVLGRPQETIEHNAFTHELLAGFSDRIRTETGAAVVYPEEDASWPA